MHKHNKKRNVGLLSEFFSRAIAEAAIENKHDEIHKIRAIWEQHFCKDTLIRKEFKNFIALHKTKLSEKSIAASLLENIKKDTSFQNQEALDEEKNKLLNDISKLNDSKFFERSVPDYKSFASVQVVMNAWRGTGFKGNYADLAMLEESILKSMTESTSEQLQENNLLCLNNSDENEENVSSDVMNIAYSIMNKKFNEKYAGQLNLEQIDLVQKYVYSKSLSTPDNSLIKSLNDIKKDILDNIKPNVLSKHLQENSGLSKDYILEKLQEVAKILQDKSNKFSSLNEIDDSVIHFYMTLSKLKEELLNNN